LSQSIARLATPLLAALILSACGEAPAPQESAAVILERASARIEQATSYRFLLEFEGGTAEIARGLQMRRAEGVFVGVDNFDAQVLVSAGPIDARVGVRVVAGASWMTNPLTQRWEQTPLSVAQLFDLSTGVTALMRSAANPKIGASETIEGVAVRRIEGELPSERFTLLPGVPPGQTLKAAAWVGTQDDLVRRLEVSGRGAPFATTAGTEGKVRLTLSAFDEPFAIEAPR
jgi:LppX_LprAFG lipoprotein